MHSDSSCGDLEYRGCDCGNIMMQGHHLTNACHIPFSMEESLRWRELAQSLFVVGSRGVSITRLDKASGKILPSLAIHVKCDMCGSMFKFIILRGDSENVYVQFLDNFISDKSRRMSAPCKLQPLTTVFPPPLRRFVATGAGQRVSDSITSFIRNLSSEFTSADLFGPEEAPDPETMFRDEPELFVSAFPDRWTAPMIEEY